MILSKGGKAGGKYQHWLNVKDLDDETENCIDFENAVEEWRPIEENVFLAATNKKEYDDAKQKELTKWQNMVGGVRCCRE